MIQGPGGGKLPRLRHEPDRLCLKARETEVVAKTSEAFVVCQSGVASGYAPAMYFLAYMYGQGVGTERDLDKERDLLHQATKLGHLWLRHPTNLYFPQLR